MTVALAGAGIRFGDRWIFRNLTFTVEPGQCLVILGPNGRGKTTALGALLGFQPLTEGKRSAPSRLGYVPQLSTSLPSYALREMVVMGRCTRMGLFGQPGIEDYRAADAAMERVGVAHLAGHAFDRLSGGERQLGLLARALATGSNVLILDEPGSALDLKNQEHLLLLIDELRRSRTMTIVFTTHDPNDALLAADEALLMISADDAIHGPVAQVMSESNLARLYGLPMREIRLQNDNDQFERMLVPRYRMRRN